MKKNSEDKFASFSQTGPAPADMFQNINKVAETDLDDIFLIINTFSNLPYSQKEQVLKQLEIITSIESPKRELSLAATAKILGKTERTVKNYIKEGKLTGNKVKGRWYFNYNDIERCKRKL